jgi:diacylglycerol kinase (ATP)
MRITLDGQRYRTGSPAVTISNGPYHGFGFALTPDADPRDGLFDVAIFTGMTRLDVLLHFVRVARHREAREPRVIIRRAREVSVEGQRRQHPVHVDGRSVGMSPVTFRIDPGALRLFRP